MVSILSGTGLSSLSPMKAAAKKAIAPKEGMFYKKIDGQNVQCLLCPRECVISDGKRGFCRNRENQKSKLYTIVYGKPSVVDIGPIEKAPIDHFVPGHFRLCITCASCNLRCKYCQNWHLSQKSLEELNHSPYSPKDIIQEAKRQKLNSNSFTYTEPTVYYEYLYEISSVVLDGVVVAGWRTGAPVHMEFLTIPGSTGCVGAPVGVTCFEGTIHVGRAPNGHD